MLPYLILMKTFELFIPCCLENRETEPNATVSVIDRKAKLGVDMGFYIGLAL